MRKVYIIIIAAWMFGTVAAFTTSVDGATYFKSSITTDEIRGHYRAGHAKILLVPGHEPFYGGTEYGSIKERDIVVMIADELEELLEADKNLEIYRTRDVQDWDPIFSTYFKEEWENIKSWFGDNKQNTIRMVDNGMLEDVESVQHNNAAPDVALRLYGINKWANENDVDIALHLHINDTSERKDSEFGPYIGFAVYVPEKQNSNAEASRETAQSIKERLEKAMNVSNMPQESGGLIEDQELIALGRYNTSDAASVLIEYGYIYESQFASEESQHAFARRVAKETYLGLRDFLGKK